MELALSLGLPLDEIGRMSQREFVRWNRFAARRMLPWQRMEWYLAQLAYMIAVTIGGRQDAKISDYLAKPAEIDEAEEEMSEDEQFDAAVIEFDFKPRNRRQ